MKVLVEYELEFDIEQGESCYRAIWTGRIISPLSIFALQSESESGPDPAIWIVFVKK